MPPVLTVQVSSGPAFPQWRGLPYVLVSGGWRPYLASVLATARLYRIREILLMGCFGDDFAKWPDGTYAKAKDPQGNWSYVRQQNLHSYIYANGTVPDPATNLQDFQDGIAEIQDADIQVSAYVGPPIGPPIQWHQQLDASLAPYRGITSLYVDGSGVNDPTALDASLRLRNFHLCLEPLASLSIPSKYTDYPSFTLTQSLRDPSSYHPFPQYTGERLLLENDRTERDPDYWERFDYFTSLGFRMCLPHIHAVWDTWYERYGIS